MGRPANLILDDLEDEWAPRLRAVSLVAELDFQADQVRLAARCLGMLFEARRQYDARIRRKRLSQYPACVAVALSGLGALEYQSGSYWPSFFEVARLREDVNSQAEWGDLYLAVLARFGCPTFEDIPRKYVGPILLHAGVPKNCLPDLIDLVVRRLEADERLDGPRFVQWARSGGRDSRLASVDKPVQYFLRDAGEFAVDWVDRLIDLVDRLRDPAPDLDGVRLPDWVVHDVRLHLEATPPRARGRGRLVGRAAEGARLALDPVGIGVHLVLPPVGEQPDGMATWHVALDGELQIVRSRAAWPGASETVPGTTVVLGRPVRSASVALGLSALTTEVDVVDPQDPMLVFSSEGRRLPASLPLPPEPVWVLRPEDLQLKALGDAPIIGAGEVPYGWDGWALDRVDLTSARAFRCGDAKVRNVRGSSRARLELAQAVVGATSAYGTPVYAIAPMVLLPVTVGASAQWSVLVRRPGGNPLRAVEVEATDETSVNIFENVTRPLLGPYEVVVRGPLGRGLSREMMLVDGLSVTSDPPWREFAPQGLVPCEVDVRAREGVALGGLKARLDPRDVAFGVEVSGSGCTETVQIEPPHMVAQVVSSSAVALWHSGPLRLVSENLSQTEAVAVRLPDQIDEGAVLLFRGDELVQSTSVRKGAGGVARLDARRFSDTVGASGSGRLELELIGRRIPLAIIGPRRLASSVSLDQFGGLQLVDGADLDDLVMGVYTICKPWLAPTESPVTAGTAGPFPDLVGNGDLLVHLRVEDPWLPSSWPTWPPYENTYRCGGELEARGPEWEQRLSGWLAGRGELIFDEQALAPMLTVYGLRDELDRVGVQAPIRDGLAKVLAAASPEQFASAVVASRLGHRQITAVFIHAGGAERPTSSADIDPAVWTRSAAVAVCSASARLASGSAEALEDMRHAAGPAGEAILAGGADPHAEGARFGPEAVVLSAMSPEAVDGLWRAANIVPAQLLDSDSRAAAARQLFDARNRPGLQRVALLATQITNDLAALIADRGHASLAAAITARRGADGWQSLPSASLALASAARVASRGDDAMVTGELERWRSAWASLARHAPDLVEIDLVLAECLLLGAVA